MKEMIDNHELDDQGDRDYLEYTNTSTISSAGMSKAAFFCLAVSIVILNSSRNSDGVYFVHIYKMFSSFRNQIASLCKLSKERFRLQVIIVERTVTPNREAPDVSNSLMKEKRYAGN